MRDMTAFEVRLGDAYGRLADGGLTAFDPSAIADAAINSAEAQGGVGIRGVLQAFGRAGRPVRYLVILGLLALVMALALLAGSRRQAVPPPFGPAGNGLITYVSDGDVYVGDAVTGTSTRIVTSDAAENDPLWSPDGTRITFLRPGSMGDDVFVVAPDGSGLTLLNREPLRGTTLIDWSPDGRWIGAVADRGTGPQLLLLPTDGSGDAVVLVDGLDPADPVFRPPDGAEIAFRGTDDDGMVALYSISIQGGPPRALTVPATNGNPFHLRFARYAPDGTRIAVQQWVRGEMGVSVMNADGSRVTRIPQVEGTWFNGLPVWAPQGDRIAFVQLFADEDGPHEAGGRYAIVDLGDPTAPRSVGPTLGQHGGQIEWSPDGTRLLLRLDAMDAPAAHQVLIDPTDGSWVNAPWTSNSWPSWQRVMPTARPQS